MAKMRCYGCMKQKTQPICEHCGWDEKRKNASHQLPVGTVLRNQYVIGRALGQGGFGITYLGWDLYLDIPVAIKEYYPSGIVSRDSTVSTVVSCGDGEIGERFRTSKERFMRESRTLARFSEVPEVVQVKSFFPANNTAYLVMEYVQGITMKEYVRRCGGRLTMERTLEMLRPVIRTLDKVHKEGIVHRDISPDNIMMLPNGRMKLIDFGAVRDVGHADVDTPMSRSTEAILKQGFAPIEQYQNRGSLGPWTDVYALCATIYYCVTGHVLLDALGRLLDSPQLHLRQEAAMTLNQERTLNQGLELLPNKRIRSMAELEQLLYTEEIGKTLPLEDNTIPADIGRTMPLEDDRTVPLDDDRTIPLNRDAMTSRRNETTPIEQENPDEPKFLFDMARKVMNLTKKQLLVGVGCLVVLLGSVGLLLSQGDNKPLQENPPVDISSAQVQKEPDVIQTGKINGSDPEGQEVPGDEQTVVIDETDPQVQEVPDDDQTNNVPTTDPPANEEENPAEDETVAATEDTSGKYIDNMLMEDPVYVEDWLGYTPGEKYTNTVFDSEYHRSSIATINFLDSTSSAPHSAWDVSGKRNGSVLAWVTRSEKNPGLFDLYIAADGGVIAPENCERLFCNYSKVTEINFNGNFDPSVNWRSDDGMFAYCSALESLDLSGFYIYGSTRMFYMCSSLSSLNISGFSVPFSITGMYQIFYGCEKLKDVTIDHFECISSLVYFDFVPDGMKINGSPWKDFFEKAGCQGIF